MSKHVKLYEQFQSENTLMELKAELIIENVINKLRKKGIDLRNINSRLYEQDEYQDEFTKWLYTDEPLNSAESRAQAQGKQILNKRQMAVMYLAALGDYEYGDITEYVKVIPGMQDYDFTNMPKSGIVPILCEVFDVDSDRTFNLTMIKFKNHMTGDVEDPEVLARHADYEKLRQVYEILSLKAMKDGPNDIAAALADAVGSADNLQGRLDDIETRKESQSAYNQERRDRIKQEDAKIGQTVYELVKQLKDSPFSTERYSKMIYDRMPNIDPYRVYDAYINFLKNAKESLKFFPFSKPGLS